MNIICKCGNDTFHDSNTDFAMCSVCHNGIKKSTGEIIEPYDFGGTVIKIENVNDSNVEMRNKEIKRLKELIENAGLYFADGNMLKEYFVYLGKCELKRLECDKDDK